MAEAAPVVVKASSTKQPSNPDEAVRSLVSAQLGQVAVVQPIAILPRPSEILPSPLQKGAKSSAPIVTSAASVTVPPATNTSSTNSLDPGLPSSGQGTPQAKAIYIPPSPQAVAPAVPPVSRPAASSELSEAKAPFTDPSNGPMAGLPFPEETKANPAQEPAKATRGTFISQQPAAVADEWVNLSDIGNLTNNLVSNSQKMVLSIRSDASALLSMGSVRLEIPSAFSSRLILGSTVQSKNSQLPNLVSNSDSPMLSFQVPRRGNNPAMRLLLTQKAPSDEVFRLIVLGKNQKSVAFTVIGAHRFSNKPNV